ncbi:hypothetical protein Y88_0640 [Novosphingobium nitrogenifigens DSM 19370]|uniref:Flp/Fap pilin component n=1 Tax=Novosphingobium nitrogenifigens DSM 19370 TaxID=983920 RepID=F1ZA09_9SPHN|nr:Flp family type IVb pilin [Novosphingobium nitrogenifigens]EGD58583.1 hypothetical protein Y88_0640 [Novosphingobium nitrogenifigens DSM 19370]
MKKVRILRQLRDDRRGATAIEYGLIAALVAVAAISAMGALGNGLSNTFQAVANDMSNSTDGNF